MAAPITDIARERQGPTRSAPRRWLARWGRLLALAHAASHAASIPGALSRPDVRRALVQDFGAPGPREPHD